jgi:FkbM family methyltransferase
MLNKIQRKLLGLVNRGLIILPDPNAASASISMDKIASLLKKNSNINITNIFEIGANLGQDAENLRALFQLGQQDVFVFEPHPDLYNRMIQRYNFNAFNLAIGDKTAVIDFNFVKRTTLNSGVSSALKHKTLNDDLFFTQKTQLITLKDFVESNNIKSIDLLKIDVEGYTFEVLSGSGDFINNIKVIQLESELNEVWVGQVTFHAVADFLSLKQFQMVHFELLDGNQCDSMWIRKEYLK